jgi:hypothetical protein
LILRQVREPSAALSPGYRSPISRQVKRHRRSYENCSYSLFSTLAYVIPDRRAPVFISWCRDRRSAPVTHQDQGFGSCPLWAAISRPWQLIAPENYRCHAASKVRGSQIHWLSLFGGQPYGGSRRGRTIESQHRRVVDM